ncbi:hypothetical protein PG987_002628 [Apiospora arundinis]|uniref:Uncharacterized protein n=1 Tax=Apiospora arundinis TaxID=335852 RepID=A0ABR2JB64_9PEZI
MTEYRVFVALVGALKLGVALDLLDAEGLPVLGPPGSIAAIAEADIDVRAADEGDGLAVGVNHLAAGRRAAAADVEGDAAVGALERGRLCVKLAKAGGEEVGGQPAEEVGRRRVEEVCFQYDAEGAIVTLLDDPLSLALLFRGCCSRHGGEEAEEDGGVLHFDLVKMSMKDSVGLR